MSGPIFSETKYRANGSISDWYLPNLTSKGEASCCLEITKAFGAVAIKPATNSSNLQCVEPYELCMERLNDSNKLAETLQLPTLSHPTYCTAPTHNKSVTPCPARLEHEKKRSPLWWPPPILQRRWLLSLRAAQQDPLKQSNIEEEKPSHNVIFCRKGSQKRMQRESYTPLCESASPTSPYVRPPVLQISLNAIRR